MDLDLKVGQSVQFEGDKYEIIRIFQPTGSYSVFVLKRGNNTRQAFRYQLEVNFLDSDDDEVLGTINFGDLFDSEIPWKAAAPNDTNRFVKVSNEEVDLIQSSQVEQSTQYSAKWGVRVFEEWLTFRGFSSEFHQLEPTDLNGKLRLFYLEARTKEGKQYSKSALIGIRAAINRFLQAPPFLSTMNVTKDKEFMSSNHVLVGGIKDRKRQGKDVTVHKDAISPGDLKKLFDSGVLSVDNPLSLVRKVWFDIMYHFGRRGREGLRDLRPDSFSFRIDDTGEEYVSMTYNESDKTHHGVDGREKEKEARMYASNDSRCPVTSLRLYLSKRSPFNNAFFQRPLNLDPPSPAACWYYNKAMGVKTLGSIMSDISKDAGLSQRYTNHCVRATCATILNDAGVHIKGIVAVTGHRNEGSVRSYVQRPSAEQRRSFSRALHSAVAPSTLAVLPSIPAAAQSDSRVDTETKANFSQTSHSVTRVNVQKFPEGFLQNANISGGTFNFNFSC